MASQDYILHYKGDNTDLLGKTNVLIRALRLLDSVADRLIPKLKTMFTPAGSTAGKAVPKVQALATALQNVQGAAANAGQALQGVHVNAGKVTKPTQSAARAVTTFTKQLVGLQATRMIFQEIMQASKELEEYWRGIAKETTEFRDSLRELASLKGEKGPNNTVVADVLELGIGTGMTPEKAREFASAYENIGPTVREKQHYQPTQGTAADLEKAILVESARTARRLGVDEKAAGEAIGTAGVFHTFTSTEDAMEQLGGALLGLSEGKLAYTSGVRALSKGAAVLVDPQEAEKEGAKAGKIGSFAEAGVYMGALSLGTGTADQAQMRMIQLSRVLNPDSTKETAVKALRGAGITDQMTDPEKLIQLSRHLSATGADPMEFLVKNELGTVSTREKTVAALKVADVLDQRLKRLRASQKTNAAGQSTIAANTEFIKTDRSAAAAQVTSIGEALDKTEGAEKFEVFEKAKEAAARRYQLRHPEYYKTWRRTIYNGMTSPLTQFGFGVGGEEYQNELDPGTGAIPTLVAEGKRVGVDMSKFPGLTAREPKTRARAFTLAAEAVKARGGDPLGISDLTTTTRKRISALRADDHSGPAAAPATPQAHDLARQQLEETKKTNRLLEGKQMGRPVRPIGPLPSDVDTAGPLRTGQ